MELYTVKGVVEPLLPVGDGTQFVGLPAEVRRANSVMLGVAITR